MTIRVYKSTDASAPTLTSANNLPSLLKACLVTGYGAISGAGWSVAYETTGRIALKQGVGSNGRYLCIDDVGNFTYARVWGFESMPETPTSLTDGTNKFPTDVQQSGGQYWKKNDGTARPWVIVADEKLVYYWTAMDASENGNLYAFGDVVSLYSGDTYNTILWAAQSDAYADNQKLYYVSYTPTTTAKMAHMSRGVTQLGSSEPVNLLYGSGGLTSVSSSVGSPKGLLPYPNFSDNGLYVSDVLVGDTTIDTVRGSMPGLFYHLHTTRPLPVRDTFTGNGVLAGKSFVMLSANAAETGWLVETSDTWYG